MLRLAEAAAAEAGSPRHALRTLQLPLNLLESGAALAAGGDGGGGGGRGATALERAAAGGLD